MLNVDSLEKGVVIDHIAAGKCMEIYRVLELDKLDCSVAIIKNARSNKSGRKDIIKIEDRIDIDLDVLGFIDPSITVNIIEGGRIVEKKHLTLPGRIVNVAKCKIPAASPAWSRSWTMCSCSPIPGPAPTAACTANRSIPVPDPAYTAGRAAFPRASACRFLPPL